MIKKIILLILIAGVSKTSLAQYKPVEAASSLKFTIKNLGFSVEGTFSGFDGTINFDPQNPSGSKIDVTINAATVNTDNSLRDEHLKQEGYFDIKNNPRIRMESNKITATGKATYQFNGLLTIKGKSQTVTFPFMAEPLGDGYAFKGSFKMKRKDFSLGGTSTVSDEVEVNINLIAKK
ncbi:YceI family protein [Mucilaginibacter gossypii]|uniref:Polyisoprenoid-binding protein YceI n=1 Tax=Mucilaginibacter gossypii TaxID=551996 RepID=A0A1G8BWA2_9SPHI|nr:YceI family protein [Mucilaginibacter gossypii]SDH36990.1 Polyisoprenoid-binding protein YceI [Mucilaginibacter gossypii]